MGMPVKKISIPKEVQQIANALQDAGFKAYLVGGCVRDFLLTKEPKDWDVATNATPEEIQGIFKDSVYENNFGTVGVKTESEDPKLKIVEITTFRKEDTYTDKRHPDEVIFSQKIDDDLARRDFTINAIAMGIGIKNKELEIREEVDPFDGKTDLNAKLIRAVGNPEERFEEDALRLMRAVRLAAELGFEIEPNTAEAIKKHAGLLEFIAKERIRDEFIKIVMSERAKDGLQMMED